MVHRSAAVPGAELSTAETVRKGRASAGFVEGAADEDLGLPRPASLAVAPDARVGVWDQEVARARTGGDRRVLGQCLAASGRAHMSVAEIPAARERFLECLAVANGSGEELVAEAHVGLGWAALAQGHYGAAASHLDLALALTTATPSAANHTKAAARVWSAELACRRWDHDVARGHYRAALDLVPPAQAPDPSARALVGLARLALAHGDLYAADRLVAEALELARQAADAYLVALCLEARGELALARGEGERARSLLGQALALARRHHDRVTEAAAWEGLGRLARSQGDVAAASAAHHRALALRSQVGDRAGVADSVEALGRADVATGGGGPGVRLMAAAHALRQRLGHPRPALDTDGYVADLSAARQDLGQAEFEAEWAAGVGIPAQEAVALAGWAAIGRPANRWHALTPAEGKVVELVAQGLANADVARRLGISPRTVQGHLRNVLAELALPTRDALVREARTR